MVVATVVIAAATAVNLLVACAMWNEMHKGGVDTHSLAVAAATQATNTHDLAVQAQRQADKMKDVSDAAEKIRKAAENMAVQEQRIADNAKTSLDAMNYFLHAVVRLVPNNPAADKVLSSFPYQGIPHFQSFVGMMPPGETHTGTATSYDQNSNARSLSKEELSEMDTGQAFIIVYAEVKYKDIFGVDHWTRSCVYTKGPSVHAVYASKCPLYDDVDNN
jgi:hypothetical protein